MFICVSALPASFFSVGQGLQVKLADFGLARGLQDHEYYRLAHTTMLPLRWMAPECVLYGTFLQESDIWWEPAGSLA